MAMFGDGDSFAKWAAACLSGSRSDLTVLCGAPAALGALGRPKTRAVAQVHRRKSSRELGGNWVRFVILTSGVSGHNKVGHWIGWPGPLCLDPRSGPAICPSAINSFRRYGGCAVMNSVGLLPFQKQCGARPHNPTTGNLPRTSLGSIRRDRCWPMLCPQARISLMKTHPAYRVRFAKTRSG